MGALLLIIALVVAAAIAITVLKLLVGLVVAIVLALAAVYVWHRYVPRRRSLTRTTVTNGSDPDTLSH